MCIRDRLKQCLLAPPPRGDPARLRQLPSDQRHPSQDPSMTQGPTQTQSIKTRSAPQSRPEPRNAWQSEGT
eukprot:12584825-Alexandrium_andersonii.AAC.1